MVNEYSLLVKVVIGFLTMTIPVSLICYTIVNHQEEIAEQEHQRIMRQIEEKYEYNPRAERGTDARSDSCGWSFQLGLIPLFIILVFILEFVHICVAGRRTND